MFEFVKWEISLIVKRYLILNRASVTKWSESLYINLELLHIVNVVAILEWVHILSLCH